MWNKTAGKQKCSQPWFATQSHLSFLCLLPLPWCSWPVYIAASLLWLPPFLYSWSVDGATTIPTHGFELHHTCYIISQSNKLNTPSKTAWDCSNMHKVMLHAQVCLWLNCNNYCQFLAVVHQGSQGTVLTPVSQGAAVQYAAVGQSGSQKVTSSQSTGKTKKISVITIE